MEVHHLIEQRFAERLGLEPGDIPSVVLDKTFHQKVVTSKLFTKLPTYPKKAYKLQEIWDKYVEVYGETLGRWDWLEAIWPYFENLGVK